CAAFFLLQRKTLTTEENLLVEAKQEKRTLEDILVKLDILQQQRDLFERKINLINQLKSHQGTAVTIMDQLSKNIPDWVWLSEANYNNQIINIKGMAFSNNLIADYIYNLENSPYFSNVNLISSIQRTIQNNRCVEFSLNATYVLPPGVMSSSEEITQKEKP
ncbi:MAG: PilN domain-containing protein, partial [Acidobacteriota bacterium]|nr:PilN domain-containing protein [Acidobacteriota bacterium]